MKGEGKVDFYINSEKKWLFEFAIGDDRRRLYYGRFNIHNGIYKDFDFKNFQIVNIVIQNRDLSRQLFEKWKGFSFLLIKPQHNFTKATLYLFKRNQELFGPLTPTQRKERIKNKDGNEWLRDGEYAEPIVIEFANKAITKILCLQLCKGNAILGEKNTERVSITLESFEHQIRESFKDQLQEKDRFMLTHLNKPIENDEQLTKIPDAATVKIQIIQ